MATNALAHGVWVLLCDGRKALLAENTGDAAAVHLEVRETFEHEDAATRDLGTDKPGRLFSGTGERRSATEPTDLHALAEREFLRSVADRLEAAVSEGRVTALVVVAPPQALGALRRLLAPTVRKTVRHEIEKDYVNMPMYEVERYLAGAMAERASRD